MEEKNKSLNEEISKKGEFLLEEQRIARLGRPPDRNYYRHTPYSFDSCSHWNVVCPKMGRDY